MVTLSTMKATLITIFSRQNVNSLSEIFVTPDSFYAHQDKPNTEQLDDSIVLCEQRVHLIITFHLYVIVEAVVI